MEMYRGCCNKFATGLDIIISPVANFAQHPLHKYYMYNPARIFKHAFVCKTLP